MLERMIVKHWIALTVVKNVAAVLVLFLVWQEKYLPRS